jgi:hypothetical protein
MLADAATANIGQLTYLDSPAAATDSHNRWHGRTRVPVRPW